MSSTTATARAMAGPPADSIVSQMQGVTITQGWDVVCAISIEQINALFAQQYINNLSQGATLPPINGTVPIVQNISAQFVDLTLGPPLVSFSPALEPQELSLSIPFLSGIVYVIQSSGSATTVLSAQLISEADGYMLAGTVPLKSIQGQVQNSHDVVIDIVNGKSFAANLDVGGSGAATILGQYFLTWLQNNAANFKYKLGSLVYGNSNLTPAGTFQFATQQNAQDASDKGRLLLFIPTTYNPNGGSQTSIGIPNIVPAGYSAALVISSQVLFSNVLANFYSQLLSPFGVSAKGSQAKPGGSYVLEILSGTITIPAIQVRGDIGGDYIYTTFSGTGTSPTNYQKTNISMPLTGIQIAPANNQLQISCANSWSQNFFSIIAGLYANAYATGSVGLHTNISCQTANQVDPTENTITFSGEPNIGVSFDEGDLWQQIFGNNALSNSMAAQIASTGQQLLQKIFTIAMPEVNAFAVSNLLFPGQNVFSFGDAFVPGDLVVFGTIKASAVSITPPAVTLSSKQTQQFTATNADGSAVKWTAVYGSINSSGLYTAPVVTNPTVDTVIATSSANGNQQAAAIVNLFPAAVQVSPSFQMITAGSSTQTFTASGSGASNVTWSISPQLGSISSAGVYTPPATVATPQAVTVTAAGGSGSGSALIVVVATAPNDVVVTPDFVSTPLIPGATQQFKAVVGQVQNPSITWSVLPAGQGSITPDGLYTAPASISAPTAVLILATDSISVLYGTALVLLAPSGS